MQVRWKQDKDPEYSGTWEIPAGAIEKHESVHQTLRREVWEETGLKIKGFKPDIKTKKYSNHGDQAFAFAPFCCQQQTGEKRRVGFCFVCTVKDGDPTPNSREMMNVGWMKLAELRKLVKETPENVIVYQLGALDFYLNYRDRLGK